MYSGAEIRRALGLAPPNNFSEVRVIMLGKALDKQSRSDGLTFVSLCQYIRACDYFSYRIEMLAIETSVHLFAVIPVNFFTVFMLTNFLV